ncbi:MAG: serine hydroxymethyltransferase [Bacteroidota bacterium]
MSEINRKHTNSSFVFNAMNRELNRQQVGIELIASENFTSVDVMRATGSVLTNKYAEGLPGKRYYGGCKHVDEVEEMAQERAKLLFGAEWANVQPHSGAQANAAVMLACLKPGDKILGFDLAHGGHLTHGSPANFSGKLYEPIFYGVEKETGLIDFDKVVEKARQEKPKMIICGASAYSRDWDYAKLRSVADEIGAVLLGDVSHTAGLIAAKELNDPLPHCHIVTTTTHKTLRGPRGGIIMMGKKLENPMGITNSKGKVRQLHALLDSGVFPGTQGGPLMHVIAGKAVAFGEALRPQFKDYAHRTIRNAQALAKHLTERGFEIISGGTDNHLMLIDLRNKGVNGKQAEAALQIAEITTNKNMVPFDTESPMVTSGLRIGTAAITTRGMKAASMEQIAEVIDRGIQANDDERARHRLRTDVHELMRHYPLDY